MVTVVVVVTTVITNIKRNLLLLSLEELESLSYHSTDTQRNRGPEGVVRSNKVMGTTTYS